MKKKHNTDSLFCILIYNQGYILLLSVIAVNCETDQFSAVLVKESDSNELTCVLMCVHIEIVLMYHR